MVVFSCVFMGVKVASIVLSVFKRCRFVCEHVFGSQVQRGARCSGRQRGQQQPVAWELQTHVSALIFFHTHKNTQSGLWPSYRPWIQQPPRGSNIKKQRLPLCATKTLRFRAPIVSYTLPLRHTRAHTGMQILFYKKNTKYIIMKP